MFDEEKSQKKGNAILAYVLGGIMLVIIILYKYLL